MFWRVLLTAFALCASGGAGADPLTKVDSTAKLQNIPSQAVRFVVRLGQTVIGDQSPRLFLSSSSACSLNSGAGDGQTQVRSADAKCWLAVLPAQGAAWAASVSCDG